MIIISFFHKLFCSGTKYEVLIYEPWFVIHLVLYMLDIYDISIKAYINIFLNIFYVITTLIYVKYGKNTNICIK